MLIYGAGGHARVLISCLKANRLPVDAIFDDDETRHQILGYKVDGVYQSDKYPATPVLIAIGSNQLRYQIAKRIRHPFGIQVHPSALVDESVKIGAGSVILHGSIIQTGAKIGEQVIINTGARIDHDCLIADYVHIAPGSILCGHVEIGSFTLVGAGSVVIPGIKIGMHCHIAAGSVITRNIPDGSVVRGNPGRIIKSLF
jgi:sugar O-acyltransferase (sialic acid O-acetyltransferase NeuD family)